MKVWYLRLWNSVRNTLIIFQFPHPLQNKTIFCKLVTVVSSPMADLEPNYSTMHSLHSDCVLPSMDTPQFPGQELNIFVSSWISSSSVTFHNHNITGDESEQIVLLFVLRVKSEEYYTNTPSISNSIWLTPKTWYHGLLNEYSFNKHTRRQILCSSHKKLYWDVLYFQ